MNLFGQQKYRILLSMTVIGLFLFTSCEKKVQFTAPVLDESTMVKVMANLFIAEVKAIDTYELSIQKSKYLKEYVYPAVFDSLNVNDSLFYQSYEFYDQQPLEMSKLLEKVIVTLDAFPIDSAQVSTDKKSLDQAYKEIHELEKIKENTKKRKKRKE